MYFESDDEARVEALTEEFERSTCPHEPTSGHRCPNRWFIIHTVVDAEDAAEVEDLLNE